MAIADQARGPAALVGVITNTKESAGFTTHVVHQKYIDRLHEHGLCALGVPAAQSEARLDAVIDRLDGLLLTGATSCVDPELYAEPETARFIRDPDRDRASLHLIQRCARDAIPLFGICRGMQEIQVAFGGALIQDIAAEREEAVMHIRPAGHPDRYGLTHPVSLAAGGFLASGAERDHAVVNSVHHQGVAEPAPGLRAEAWSPSGLVEALVLPDHPFLVGVEWHAEHPSGDQDINDFLFQAFAAACKKRRDESPC